MSDTITLYQVREWNEHFENAKSREIERCSFVCLPNKQHGMGFRRIMAMPDGAMIYGIWVCIIEACSQQKAPRHGYLTEDGRKQARPWDCADIALKIGRPVDEIERCIAVVTSEAVDWLTAHQLPAKYPASTRELPMECPPTTLEQNRTEGTEQKELLRAVAVEILTHLNTKASREFRATGENIDLITRRLGEVDGDAEGVKVMIDRMCAKWKADEKMCNYLRPTTLFGKSKFHGYYDDRNQPVRGGKANYAGDF